MSICAHLEIAMRNGTSLSVNLTDDEAVNRIAENLKKTILDQNGIFSLDMKLPQGGSVMHYIPSREIVRYSLTQTPRVPATA